MDSVHWGGRKGSGLNGTAALARRTKGEGKGVRRRKRCQEPLFDIESLWAVICGHHGTSQTSGRRRDGVSRFESRQCTGDDL